jgi:murein DD-endopeptidase MepM/ murein hydrolase activator NlpD
MAIKLIVPVSGPITQMFGENPGLYKQWGYAGHNGIDYGVPNGTPVKAAADGTVASVSFENGGYGNFVRISHLDGSTAYFTYYAHLASTAVTAGQKVKAGAVVGASNNTGASTGPHLHFGLKIEGQNPAYKGYLDPQPYFKSAPSPDVPAPASTPGTVEIPETQFEVAIETLNVRNGPGVEYSLVGTLTKGTKVSSKMLNSRSAWIEIQPGKWCAVVFEGTQYLKIVKK